MRRGNAKKEESLLLWCDTSLQPSMLSSAITYLTTTESHLTDAETKCFQRSTQRDTKLMPFLSQTSSLVSTARKRKGDLKYALPDMSEDPCGDRIRW